jgi:Na+/H+-dicarboxylate symporter
VIRTDPAPRSGPPRRRVPNVTVQIFIGLLLGILVGQFFPGFAVAIRPLADVFLRMIKMIIAPLLFATSPC